MHRRIERLVSGHAKKLALAAQPFNYLLQNNNRQLQEDSKYVDLQVGKQVWFNVPRRMRQELWLSVLHKHKGAGATAAKQFATFVKQSLPVDVDADIEKDVGRTFPSSARFATAAGKLSLQRVLRAYAVYDTEVGYCQGMNFLAGLLLTYMPNEACAFGGLVVLMQERKLRELYKTDLAQLQIYLWQFGTLLPAKLAQHMEEQGTLPVLYVSSWLLTSFGSDFPLFFSSRVLDVVLTGSYPHAMIKVALGLLQKCEKQLLPMTDMEDIVHYLKAEVPCWSREELQDVLSDALSQPWSAQEEAVLSNELGMETVIDAVGRVNSLVKSGSRTPSKTLEAPPNLASIPQSPSTTATLTAAAAQVLHTPTRYPSTNPKDTPPVSSPLPPMPRGPALSSTKSASWVARLHAQPSTGAVQSARRHTTEEAAPAVHALHGVPGSGGSSTRGSLDGDVAGFGVDLLGLEDGHAEIDWQQAERLQPGVAESGAQTSWADDTQHSTTHQAAQVVHHAGIHQLGTFSAPDGSWHESAHQHSVAQPADDMWANSPQQQNTDWAAGYMQADNAPQHSIDQGLGTALDTRPVQQGQQLPASLQQAQQQLDVVGQLEQRQHQVESDLQHTSPGSEASLQADPSMLSTSSDIQQADLWHSAGASVVSSSSDIPQLEVWHGTDAFGGFESADHGCSPSQIDTLPLAPQVSHEFQASSTVEGHLERHADDNELEAWGSFILPDGSVAPEPLKAQQGSQLQHESSVHAADDMSDAQNVCAPDTAADLPSNVGLGVEHLDSKQQKQLELFMLSISQSEAGK